MSSNWYKDTSFNKKEIAFHSMWCNGKQLCSFVEYKIRYWSNTAKLNLMKGLK